MSARSQSAKAGSWTELNSRRAAELAVDGVWPRYVCAPGSVDEAGQAVARAAEEGLAVVPRGAGTGLALGFPPAAADVVLSTRGLNRVVAYEPADLTATVEAGMSIGELQRLLHGEGQFLALDPPGPAEATLGGIIATNASGPLRLAYGSARDLVIGMRVVNPGGQVTRSGGRVVKNVAGYDLNKLHIGALGTLGIVVELSFKLWPLPERHMTVVAVFDDAESAQRVVLKVLRSALNPQSVEALDAPAAARIGLDVPVDGLVLLLRAAGFERAVERQVRELSGLCAEHGGRLSEPPGDEPGLWEAVRNLSYAEPSGVLVKVSVPIAETIAMQTGMQELAGREGVALTSSWSHAGNGIVYGRLEGAMGDDSWLNAAAGFLSSARSMAVSKGGSLVLESAPAALKQRFDVWGEVGASLRVMQALKRELDPKGILNPGRFVGGL